MHSQLINIYLQEGKIDRVYNIYIYMPQNIYTRLCKCISQMFTLSFCKYKYKLFTPTQDLHVMYMIVNTFTTLEVTLTWVISWHNNVEKTHITHPGCHTLEKRFLICIIIVYLIFHGKVWKWINYDMKHVHKVHKNQGLNAMAWDLDSWGEYWCSSVWNLMSTSKDLKWGWKTKNNVVIGDQ
jgi:hypothetical protein